MRFLTGAACAVLSACVASGALAQSPAPMAPASTLHIAEGTQFSIKFAQEVSSASAVVGDEFAIETVDSVTMADGRVLPAGLIGVGEVTAAHKRGMMGKAGELSVRLDYLKVGAQHVHIRGARGGSGKDSTGTTVALVVLFGPLGLLKHGHEMTIERGQRVVAYADQDIDVVLPETDADAGVGARE